jgi:hypothetical protein
MAVRSLTFLTNFITAPDTPAHFAQPQLILTKEAVRMNVRLENGFTEDLIKLAETGTPIQLYVYVELMQEGSKTPAHQVIVESSLYYNIIEKKYCVKKSIQPDTLLFSSLDSAMSASLAFSNFLIFPVSKVNPHDKYYINMYAILGQAKVEALKNTTIDLMYYWDFKRPSASTEKYDGARFFIEKESLRNVKKHVA